MNGSAKAFKTVLFGAMALAVATSGCTRTEEQPATTPAAPAAKTGVTASAVTAAPTKDDKPEPFIARGRVTTTAGEPIPGAVVTLENTLFYRSHAEVRTAADGTYRVEIPKGAWHATAKLVSLGETMNSKRK